VLRWAAIGLPLAIAPWASAASAAAWVQSDANANSSFTTSSLWSTLVEQDVAGSAAPPTGNTVETPTLPNTPTNGDTLVAVVGDDGNHGATVSSVSGGGVATWTLVTSVGTNDQGEAEIWYGAVTCSPCSGANDAVTVTMSQNTNVQLANVSEWSGILTSASPVDQKAAGSGSALSFTAGPIPTAGSLSQTGELIITGAWVASTGFTTPQDATTGYNALSQTKAGGTYYRGYAAYQIDPSTAQISATWVGPASGNYATAIAAFKP